MFHGSFLEFEGAEHQDAAAWSDEIIFFLEYHGLEHKKNLVGQGYDGVAVMCGDMQVFKLKLKKKPNMPQ